MNNDFIIDEFNTVVSSKLVLLENMGFRRIKELEKNTPTLITRVYKGSHVAFVFSLDVRDQCVDVKVVKVKNGNLVDAYSGGYSSDLFMFLIEHEGYRGDHKEPSGQSHVMQSESKIRNEIGHWLYLLQTFGAKLLNDKPDSLPG